MAELPLLFFPKATTESPAIRGGGGAKINKPSAAEQKARLDQKFQTIANSFKDLKASADGLEPEQVVVLETIGTIEGFAQAASQIPGLEWLTELSSKSAPLVTASPIRRSRQRRCRAGSTP